MAIILNISHLVPYLTWRAPFGNTGILPLVANIISLYCPNDIYINVRSTFRHSDITRVYGFIDSITHEIIIILCGVQRSEMFKVPNYKCSSCCTEAEIWSNRINKNMGVKMKFNHSYQIIAASKLFIASKAEITRITDNLNKKKGLQLVYETNSDHPILDMWMQTNYANVHFILKRSLNSSFADIVKITSNDMETKVDHMYHFVLPDTYIVDKHCCYVVNDDLVFLMYHKYDFASSSCELAVRYIYCCSETKKMEVRDIKIPFYLLNDTYSKTLSTEKVYIMNIAQKYFFYHEASDQYLLFMDLTYRLKDIATRKGPKRHKRNSMQFNSCVFMWQFQIDSDSKTIKNIAISGIKATLSLSGNGKYCVVGFDEQNGSILLHEKNTPDFVVKRLSDIIQEWKYYLQ